MLFDRQLESEENTFCLIISTLTSTLFLMAASGGYSHIPSVLISFLK